MDYKNLIVEERDGWLEVSVNRPAALNALNAETLEEIAQVVAQLSATEGWGGMILTGAGEKAFVAGADISELTDLSPRAAVEFARKGQEVFDSIERSQKPVIAAVNGFALGGGCELALSCHIRVFSTQANIGLPEVGLGVIPGFGGTQRLSRIVGLGRALEMILTGGMVKAEEALRIGLANQVCEPPRLLETCRSIASTIRKRGPLAVSAALTAAVAGRDMTLADGLAFERAQFGLVAATEDWKEGTQAFLAKRKPDFRGR
jgi:enoyl-CoA hydratase